MSITNRYLNQEPGDNRNNAAAAAAYDAVSVTCECGR
jgi:hypothetical protein